MEQYLKYSKIGQRVFNTWFENRAFVQPSPLGLNNTSSWKARKSKAAGQASKGVCLLGGGGGGISSAVHIYYDHVQT